MTARFLVLWDTPSDVEAFERHYRDVHIPLATSLPGLRRYSLGRQVTVVRGEGQPYLVGELEFADGESLRAAFGSPEGQACAADATDLAQHASLRSFVYELEDEFRADPAGAAPA